MSDSTEALQTITIFAIAAVLIIWIIFRSISRIMIREQVEKSRREMAAYVAEGSITPADAERLLKTDPDQMPREAPPNCKKK